MENKQLIMDHINDWILSGRLSDELAEIVKDLIPEDIRALLQEYSATGHHCPGCGTSSKSYLCENCEQSGRYKRRMIRGIPNTGDCFAEETQGDIIE